MRLAISHRTEYRYSKPVFLEPISLRLRPRCDVSQTLHTYNIQIDPAPEGRGQCVDLDGNGTEAVWFNGLHERFTIVVDALVETHRLNPFAFLITDPDAARLPLVYAPRLRPALAHYLARPIVDTAVAAFADAIKNEAGDDSLRFLILLAERIRATFAYSVREHGEPWMPRETLERKAGACRDFAILYVDACRCVGIAARFVSGYSYADAAAEHHLHAWAEVYLPGGGWRGFDPSEGLAVADRHIALASGHSAEDASPVFGRYRGEAQLDLVAAVSIAKLAD